MKKYNCPECNKELIRLETFENGVYKFWCDDCDIDIVITKNNKVMKLNVEGNALYNVWYENYCKENDNLGGNSAEGDFVDGWCIIDNLDYIKNITDECGLLILGYNEGTINVIEEWIEDYGDEEIGNLGFTYTDVRNELLKYFD